MPGGKGLLHEIFKVAVVGGGGDKGRAAVVSDEPTMPSIVKRGAGRKRAAGNALDSAVTPAAARAEVEASSQPMVREGWRLDSSRRSGEVRARVRMTRVCE